MILIFTLKKGLFVDNFKSEYYQKTNHPGKVNPLWISFSGDSKSIYGNSNVDVFTSEKPCVAGSISLPVHFVFS